MYVRMYMCNNMVLYVACTLLRTCGSSTVSRSGKYASYHPRSLLSTYEAEDAYVRMVL